MSTNTFGIKSELSEVQLMASHFQSFCVLNKINKTSSGLLELALVEAINNIIIHAYDGVSGFDIHAEYEFSDSQMTITIIDFGKEFKHRSDDNKRSDKSKNTVPHSISNDLEDLAEGSWGLDLIYSISDRVSHVRENIKNILTIEKKIIT